MGESASDPKQTLFIRKSGTGGNAVKAHLLAISIFAMAGGVTASIHTEESATLESSDQIFWDARPLLGKDVAVKGVLRWTFENRNLFPLGTDPDQPSEAACLPVLIKRSDSPMQKIAEALDRSVVVVKGRIIDPAPPGKVSLGSCKPVGVEVGSIEKVG
jgi:hypothetical protein